MQLARWDILWTVSMPLDSEGIRFLYERRQLDRVSGWGEKEVVGEKQAGAVTSDLDLILPQGLLVAIDTFILR